jgi:nucleoside phosphorylase
MRVRFVAAVAEELGDLPGVCVGVGMVTAAARTARMLATDTAEAVVFVGTAGAYVGGPDVGAVVAASEVGLGAGVDQLGLGYVPLHPAPLASDPVLLGRLALPRHRVRTTVAITTDPELARRLGEGFGVEHLEAFGVALACAEVGVPFVAVLGIANRVGPGAHAEWLANRTSVEAAVRAAVGPLRSGWAIGDVPRTP